MVPDEMVRAFVAVDLGDAAHRAAVEFQRQLASALPPHAVRWSRPEQLHLTLHFLGNVPAGDMEELSGRLRGALGGGCGFELGLSRPGAFPSPQRPRVIWLGFAGELTSLREAQSRVTAACQSFGDHAESRDFHPHVTLGRVNHPDSRLGRRLTGELERFAEPANSTRWRVEAVHLYRSELRPAGAVYATLATFPLVGGG